jgi:enediyne biosynthesis protein E4
MKPGPSRRRQKPLLLQTLRSSRFKDVSHQLAYKHENRGWNDLDRQPLLHRQLSQAGPGVALIDIDADGFDDVIVGPARGSPLPLFTRRANFARARDLPGAPDDVSAVTAWTGSGTNLALLCGLSGYEAEGGALLVTPLAKAFQEVAGRHNFSSTVGPVATADIDNDGDLDVFVGGRFIPGKYPEPGPSQIYRNESGKLLLAPEESLKAVGLVNAAVFSDVTGDGRPELILACEWGPIRIFEFKGGKLNELTSSLGLAPHTGWWTGVTTGDLDGDGRLDIVAGNWGLNSSWHQPTSERPLLLYYRDFDANGSVDLIEAHRDPQLGKLVQRRDMSYLASGLPLLRTRFKTHAAFSEADFVTVLGEQPARVPHLSASTLATTIFLNRTNRFEPHLLPDEAQFAPVFGVNVADMDGDGDEDIFLAQNFFVMRPDEPRLDAGRGLWLKNDGKARFSAVPGQQSGVVIYGEQGGSAVGDFDGDARVDLVVAQHRGETKLFHNERAKPGLRVRLEGPSGNPHAIGATVWLSFGPQNGPAREIHGGSGYCSQDTLVPVLGTPTLPTAINVRWPGGRVTTNQVPPGSREVRVKAE